MSGRIRSIKPEAHKDADLWDAEHESGLPLFRAYTALWGQADKRGRFIWKPRELKIECLPFWEGDFARVLRALEKHGFIVRYEIDGRSYGWIPTFERHQHINGKESESRLPPPPEEVIATASRPDATDTRDDAIPTREDEIAIDSIGSRVPHVSTTRDSRDADAPIPSSSPSLPDPDPDPGGGAGGGPDDRFPMRIGFEIDSDTYQGLLTELIPDWAIDQLIPVAVTHYATNKSDRRTRAEWNQAIAKWVRKDFRDPNKRPKKPEVVDAAERRRKRDEAERAAGEAKRREIAEAAKKASGA